MRSSTSAIAAAVAALLLGAAVANADVGSVAPNALTPATKDHHGGGLVKPPPVGPGPNAIHVDPMGGRFTCNNSWDPIASGPSMWIIGECRGGSTFTRSGRSNPDAHGVRWDGGFFSDPGFGGCGYISWTQDTLQNAGITDSLCGVGFNMDPATFAYALNCAPGTCEDGTPLVSIDSCPEFENVQPWNSTLVPTGRIADRPAGWWFAWRYVVGGPGYAKTDAAGNAFVAVRDMDARGHPNGNGTSRPLQAGEGNWAFVPSWCLPRPLTPNNAGTYFVHNPPNM